MSGLKWQWLKCLMMLMSLATLSGISRADVGTAAQYNPPYTPTACFGNDPSQFPTNNLFAAAGEGIWDNGAACGRQYLISCISVAAPSKCQSGQVVRVRIVDRAQTSVSRPSRKGATIVLSTAAYQSLASGPRSILNIEFIQ
ncbi:EG45-like domain containing protein [Impatiens glandulifera]|uniref:EG45-like domain containing protein n=1 Tax=Impatiens glandulifera TaxID=253017 RepID=UPI001FB0A403|nr:EG45-like domain containing protein [Impatiens glandulifera]